MGRDLKLLIEHFEDEHWQVPFSFQPIFPNAHVRSFWDGEPFQSEILKVLELEFWSARGSITSAFFGDSAICQMCPGLPDDTSRNVKNYLLQNLKLDDQLLGWVNCTDLLFDVISEDLPSLGSTFQVLSSLDLEKHRLIIG